MPAETLLHLSTLACAKNFRSVKDVGELPYDTVRSILIKIDTAAQLRDIEIASPQILGHDKELWIEFIKRDVTGWENMTLDPGSPPNWYDLYEKLHTESEKQIEEDTAKLQAALLGLKSESLNHRSKQVAASTVPPLPKMGGMKYVKTPRKKKIVLVDDRPKDGLSAGSRTKTITGKGVIDKARREAKVMTLLRDTSALAVPSHKLNSSSSQVRIAPRSLLYGYQHPLVPEPLDPTKKPEPVFAPKRKRVESTGLAAPAQISPEEKERRLKLFSDHGKSTSTTAGASSMSTKERERRLKAFTNPNKSATTSIEEQELKPKAFVIPKKAPSPTLEPLKKKKEGRRPPKSKSWRISPKATAPPPRSAAPPTSVISSDAVMPVAKDGSIITLPTAYIHQAPRLQSSNVAPQTIRPMKAKAPVDIFMPAKRRRLS